MGGGYVKLFADPKITANDGDVRYYYSSTAKDSQDASGFVDGDKSHSLVVTKNEASELVLSNADRDKPPKNNIQCAYIPFEISDLKVPAYTTRTYTLTFTVNYIRNTGSGCGFFTELIQGGVPSSFNTSSAPSMTNTDTSSDGTKLRYYTTEGETPHSVTLSYTFKNEAASSVTKSLSFVLFGGHQKPGGLYQPRPSFTVSFSFESDYQKHDVYEVHLNGTKCTIGGVTSKTESVVRKNVYTATFKANDYHHLQGSVSVSVGGTALSSGYTYNSTNGTVTIPADKVTAYIEISAAADPNVYSIIYNLNGGTNDGTPDSYTYGVGVALPDATKNKRTAYNFEGWYTTADLTTKVTEVSATDHDDKTFYAKWTPITYTITLVGNLGSNLGTKGDESIKYTVEDRVSLTAADTKWEKTGHTLLGWCASSSLTDTAKISISVGSYGNKKLYAKWSDHTYDMQKKDDTNHWNECACNEIKADSVEKHLGCYGAWTVSGDTSTHSFTMKRACSVCGYEECALPHRH